MSLYAKKIWRVPSSGNITTHMLCSALHGIVQLFRLSCVSHSAGFSLFPRIITWVQCSNVLLITILLFAIKDCSECMTVQYTLTKEWRVKKTLLEAEKTPPETVKKSARQGQQIRQIRTKNPLDTDKKSTRQIFQMLKLNENPPKHWCEYEAHEL